MFQLIKVAEYLSKCGIIHRDLKPANILVIKDENDQVTGIKVSDFGLSKLIEPDEVISNSEYCGTIDYVSPEMFGDQGYGKEVDMWAIGVIFY